MGRVDTDEKLRGDARYVGDMSLPRMLHGKVLRSPMAHARIVSIDTSVALAMPGVKAILTADDLPMVPPNMSIAGRMIEAWVACSST